MKIGLIYTTTKEPESRDGSPAIMPPLSFAALAAHSGDHDIVFFDERLEVIPENPDLDLAGITINIMNVYHSYQIADKLRAAGVPVILGGYHVTMVPEEATEHADAIVIGHAELLWPELLNDFENGRLKKVYGPGTLNSSDDMVYRHDIFKPENYKIAYPVEFARGCKFSCEFCTICRFNEYKITCRRVEEVIKEIELLKSKEIFFVDDNIYAAPARVRKLLGNLSDFDLSWSSYMSLDAANDKRMLELAAASGCYMLFIGIESLNEENLKLMGKKSIINRQQILDSIKRINDYGIIVKTFFIIGYDYDTYDSIRDTFDFVRRNDLLAEFFTLLPLPGTRLYERYDKLGIINKKKYWLDPEWKSGDVVYEPLSMSVEQLQLLYEESKK